MSEKEAAPEGTEAKPAKKKGKLPMLLALVAVLGGGGFFAMKMRGGGAKPAITLGEILPLEEEFLSNLKEPDTYVRAKIALHMEKGFEKKKLEDKIPAVEDAIYLILSNKSLAQIRTLEGKMALKEEIAEAVNRIASAEGEGHKEGKKEGDAEKSASEKSETNKTAEKKRQHPDWDSDSGPILKVYFRSFATQ